MILYRGYLIAPQKVRNMPLYEAWVYAANGSIAGFKVKRDDEPVGTRDRIIQIVEAEIDLILGSK